MFIYFKLLYICIINILFIPFILLKKYSVINETYFNSILKKLLKLNGPIFIKYVQILLLDKEFLKLYISDKLIVELTDFEDKVYPNTKLEDDLFILGKNIKSQTSIASGSISDIYEIKIDNQELIIKKVIKNKKEDICKTFILFRLFLKLMYLFKNFRFFTKIIDLNNFKNLLLKQCDMDYETTNLKKFYKIFKNYDTINSPKYIYNNKSILVMEKINGLKYDDFIKKYPQKLLETQFVIFSSIYVMINNNIIHGDLHLGNMLFNINNNNVVNSIIDFGIVYNITDIQKKYLLLFMENNDIKYLFLFLNTINPKIPTEKESYRKLYFSKIKKCNIKIVKEYKIPLEILNLISILQFISQNLEKKYYNQLIDYLITNNIID